MSALEICEFHFFFVKIKKKNQKYVSGDVPIGRRHSRCYTLFSFFFFNFGAEAEHGKLHGILFK